MYVNEKGKLDAAERILISVDMVLARTRKTGQDCQAGQGAEKERHPAGGNPTGRFVDLGRRFGHFHMPFQLPVSLAIYVGT